MKAFVYPDERLGRHAGRFVWLSIDAEREGNAAFLEKYPVEAYPSLYIIDPRTGEVLLRWLGSATLAELERLLDDGERAYAGTAKGADALLARADRLYGEGDQAAAAKVYREALDEGGGQWGSRPRVVASMLFALSGSGQQRACVDEARAEVPKLPLVPARATAAGVALGCALSLPKADARRSADVAELEKWVGEEIHRATTTDTGIAADDISGLFETLAMAREDAGDEAGRKAVAREWAGFLEQRAREATTSEARAVFDSHRLSAYLEMGEPERAIPMLQESERALPKDYNPPARLALVYEKLGRYDEALAANDRALQKVYGPRKIRVMQNRADILKDEGDVAGARATLEDALKFFDALPEGQRNPAIRKRVEKQLSTLGR